MQAKEMFDERYRVVDRLGAGSEGEVFLTLYVPTEEFRAVKEIRTGENESFCRELEMLKGLRCGHLPRIIDVLPKGEYTYLVMEHVRGTSVDRILAGGRTVTQEQTLEAALQITEALCYLERRDPPVCHLDIKPSNLIRKPDGRFVLVDFGAAWKEKTCRPGKGTDGYAAPEQYDPQAVTDVRSDIYGLGAAMYRMLSGKTWSKQMYGSCVPNCCEEFGRIIGRCLEQDMSMRYESASDLRRELIWLRRKENRRHFRVRVLGALAIAFPAAAFLTAALPPSMELSNEPGWNYESLLEEAKVCREDEAGTCYRKAVFLDPGRCGYVAKKDTPVAEGVRLLHRAGGVAVLAHPMQLKKSHAALDSLIGEWAKAGLDGIEVYHPSADAGDIPALLRIAERLDLLVTGGSDFHGREVKPDVAIGQGLERWRTAEKDVLLLTERIRQRQGQRSCYHTENME